MATHPLTDVHPGAIPRDTSAAQTETAALLAAIPVTAIASLGATTNTTAVPGSFADLAAVQTFFVTHRAEVEARLDAIEAKVDAILAGLRTAGVLTP